MEAYIAIVDTVIRDTLVSLCRQVPWGASREALEDKASEFRRQAAWERGMADNHDTANHLHWQADLFQLAACARFPRAGDTHLARMEDRARAALHLKYLRDDDGDSFDFGPSRFSDALEKALDGPPTKRRYVGQAVTAEIEAERAAAAEREHRQWQEMEADLRAENRKEKFDRFPHRPSRQDVARRREQSQARSMTM